MNLPTKSRFRHVVGRASGFLPSLELRLLVVVVACAMPAQGVFADWAFDRGDSAASGVADSELTKKPQEVWRFTTDDSGFEGTAVIADGKVYLGDVDGTFYALRLDDGELVWKKKFEDSGFLAAAAIVDGRVYVGDFNGVVRCLSAADGKELWTHQARGELYAGPNVALGRVLVTTESGELYSLDPQSGSVQWSFEIDAPLRCWPTVVAGHVLLAGCDSRLHAIDLETGKETGGVDLDGQTGATPAHWDDSVFFGTASGTFYRIQGNEIRWEHRDEDHPQQVFSAAVDRRAVIYGSKGKRVYALDPASGNLLWEFPVRSSVEGAPVIAGDAVFFGTKRGRLYALDVVTGEQRWQFEAGGSFVASPAVSGGRLVIGNTDGTLYCFGEQ